MFFKPVEEHSKDEIKAILDSTFGSSLKGFNAVDVNNGTSPNIV